MARLARVVVPNVPHHLTQRGNRREDVLFDDADRQRYLALLAEHVEAGSLKVYAYCLMTNHVHLVVAPAAADALGRAMRAINSQYTAHVNRRKGWTGHLWQGRFYSTPLDEPHFWSAVRYVERNPVRARLVRKAYRYPWSSAAAHCGLRADALLAGELERSDHVADWSAWLADGDEEAEAELRRRTRTGRPCGSEEFVRKLQALLARPLLPARRGRKPKKPARRPEAGTKKEK